ncbi:NAD(P)-binding domain-containing protein [Variovorax paradoxus B4]|uniref:NAD(P)-binding domain-containing protein n=1 Tax=Variovorax paradoxus B4 TaxID=1246301 RepID=T1XJD3_VARPD|nr:NAD(P)H-binding protein [Variovorax paradoxus]AGU52651.1 NAD(P)-binding domain-containing protein [Variovorax paradoxus B4]
MYVLLGSNGNITSKVAALLLGQGTPVRVVGRNTGSLASVKAAGAEIAAGDIGDADFLAHAFAGATAAYTMIPTDYAAHDMAAEQDRLGNAITRAIAAAGLKRVVNLSSVGANLSSGTGPIAGLHRQERRLNELADVDVLHLRPGYFFENHLIAIEMIRTIGAYADMTAPDSPLPMVATADIAQVVARELRTPSGKGKHVLHLRAPSLYTMKDATAVLGAAIGKPDLAYVQSDPEQGRAALMQQGFSANAAAQLVEMSAAFSTGRLDGEYDKGPAEITPTTLADFAAAVFRPAFEKT